LNWRIEKSLPNYFNVLFSLLITFPGGSAGAADFHVVVPVKNAPGVNLSITDFISMVWSFAFGGSTAAGLAADRADTISGGLEVALCLGAALLLAMILFLLLRNRSLRISLRRREEENRTLQAEMQQFAMLFEQGPHGCAVAGLDGRYLLANKEFCKRLGKTASDVIGRTPPEIGLFSDVENNPEIRAELLEKGSVAPREVITTAATGGAFVLYSCALIEFRGQPAIYIMLVDVTAQKRQEAVLKASEESFNRLFKAAPIPLAYAFDADGYRATTWNDAWYRNFGYSREEADGRSGGDIGLWVNPDDRKFFVSSMRNNATAKSREVELRCKDGSIRHCEVHGRFIGKPGQQILSAAYLDVTDRKRAEEEREQLQKQLALSQRLESVGQLAGGVAHDYNNMLGVILGHVELARMKAGADSNLSKHLDEIQKAARKSADLTMQLLAFARKQAISPLVVDMNEAISKTLEMLRWLIGENVELVWSPGKGRFAVKIDTTQFDQVLVNLCVNARDAISGHGKITIETEMVDMDEGDCTGKPYMISGRYVLLSVADTGCGMDKMVASRIFEPFFTTKNLGQGTGLGLATVYGIVKQNSGFINVDSEPGRGTVFRIYFPAEAPGEIVQQESAEPPVGRGNGEILLVVEDEEALLEINRTMLRDLGYNVVAAGLPSEAVRLARDLEHLDLLMTDVIMPEMNGRELEEAVRALHPDVACLFMSGYTSNVISSHGILEKGVSFIQKPFSVEKLSRKVREALNSSSR